MIMWELLFKQYESYPKHEIVLELTAIVFGLWSVIFSKRNSIWVFPTGIISTAIFVYLLWQWQLLGDMTINAYYFIMSIYGWYYWTRNKNGIVLHPISRLTIYEKKWSVLIFVLSISFVIVIYLFFDKFTHWTAYVDTLTTGIFFVGMWQMAKRKIENWLFWIVGDLISVPLYFYKGYTFTSIQYLIFTFLAIWGYFEWKKHLHNCRQTS
jgi:nicotinamide mononucleotide transporter